MTLLCFDLKLLDNITCSTYETPDDLVRMNKMLSVGTQIIKIFSYQETAQSFIILLNFCKIVVYADFNIF